MQSIILAAGMGKRLKELTRDNTKCMIDVNGVTLIERMLRQLDVLGLSRIIIVEGYQGRRLIDFIGTLGIRTPIEFINNPVYDRTNNIYSLALSGDKLTEDDTLLLESDLIFEDSVLSTILDDPRPTLALVDKYESWMDGTCVKLTDDDRIESFIPGGRLVFEDIPRYYKTVNIYKFSRRFSADCYVPFLMAYVRAIGENEYYEQVLRVITMLDAPEIRAKRLDGEKWYEIDDIQDLDIAASIFAPTAAERSRLIQSRYGGYWRYPKMLDFCYLVNPYFPPRRLMDEIKANFDVLLTEYPSGMRVNSLLAAKNFGVHQENIIIGNGAAELIKLLMDRLSGKKGFIRPTFEEYPNRCSAEQSVFMNAAPPDFTYTADEVMEFFSGRDISALVMVNPDNPSGNYIPHGELLRLLEWSREKDIALVIDESFSDFSDETDNTLIRQDILEKYPELYVIKSISKSYGVPGLRLGVLASGNASAIAAMKREAAIWNINSFAEFYMQTADKYKGDYTAALELFRAERARFSEELSRIGGLRPIPSQTNYIMAELTGKLTAAELVRTLLDRYSILIKDLTSKTGGSYIRIAVRSREENDILIRTLSEILQ